MQVQVVSPERVLWSGDAERVITRVEGDGDIAFLSGHAPFMGQLGVGVTEILQEGDQVVRVAVHGGFVEVSEDRVSLLSDQAELATAIDVARARAAKEKAESLLDEETHEEVRLALAKAETRLRAAGATQEV
jgi:F-type H+-transporting ATPase subunit epsilon